MSPIAPARSRALIGLALIAGLAGPAFAETRIDVIASSAKARTLQTAVDFADLNLASADGKAALNRRIAFAAQDVCGKNELYSIDAKSDYLRCRADAIGAAKAQVQQRIATQGNSAVRLSGG